MQYEIESLLMGLKEFKKRFVEEIFSIALMLTLIVAAISVAAMSGLFDKIGG